VGETAEAQVHKGLDGVVADESRISEVMAETDELTYRGYAIEELAERRSFEDVAHLLLQGDLPDAGQRERFRARERELRGLDDAAHAVLARFPTDAHPMDKLRTGVSFLGLGDPAAATPGEAPTEEQALAVLARAPTLVAASHRLSRGEDPIEPSADAGFAENFLRMCLGGEPDRVAVDALDASLILYADHGFNASTFTARTIVSTESDLYSAVVGAIGALKGPLHGGANEAVMSMLHEIERPDRAREWIERALADKRKVMGFGHRVYRHGDSRVPTMRRHLEALADARDGRRWVEIADVLEEVMHTEKGLFPNVDFPAGPAYHLIGLDIALFTPMFVIARIAGWCAHVLEQAADNKLVRPLARYTGPEQRPVPEH
jgi:2-methylcitrate synthase/citrate synthase II